jgi:hypothetical protein
MRIDPVSDYIGSDTAPPERRPGAELACTLRE